MRLSNKSTFSLICLILLLTFAAVPVMAHQMATNAAPHDNAETTSSDPGTDHALVKSIVLSSDYLTRTAPITATITFADGVAAIPEDTDTGSVFEARHATLNVPAANPTALVFEIGTKKADGSGYTYATPTAAAGELPTLLSITKTRPEGASATGSGAVYTAYISFPTDGTNIADGHYRVGLESTAGLFNPDSARATFFMDTRAPEVTNVAARAIGQNYANSAGEWGDPFEITFNLEDPLYDPTDDGDATNAMAGSASGLDLTTIMFEVKDDDDDVTTSELRFGTVQYTGSNYVVTATPVKATTAKAAATVTVTVKASDKAGNEGMSTTPLSVKLARRAATGTDTGPGDTTAPTVTITSAKGENADEGKVIFTFEFSEALTTTGTNAFTVADINVSNAPTLVAANLTTTDNTTFMLKVTPVNKDFPVKVSFKDSAKIGDRAATANLLGSGEDGLGATSTYTPEGVLGVEIAAPTKPSLDGRLVFKFTFAEEPEDEGAGAFTVSDITTSNTEALTAADLSQSLNDEKIFRLRVTPTDATMPVTVQLNADSVRHHGPGPDETLGDADGTDADEGEDDVFLVAGEIAATYTPPTPDTTAPVVTITAPVRGSVNPLMFLIDFNEALSADLEVANLAITGGSSPALTMDTGTLPTGVAQRYTLSVTGTAGTAVTVNLMANAVEDAAGNSVEPLASAVSYTISDDRDTTKPTLAITHSPADNAALPSSGKVTFTFTFSEALGSNDAAFTVGDIVVAGGSKDDLIPDSTGLIYTLTVTPTTATTPVKVSVASNAVSDVEGNNLAVSYSETYMPPDNTHPTVTITASESRESVGGQMQTVITFTFNFSEEISSTHKGGFTRSDIDATESNFGTVRGTGQPIKDANDPTIYRFKVVAASTGATRIRLQAGSVADLSGNVLLGDQDGIYTPERIAPAITITGPNLLAQRKFVGNNITVRVSDRLDIQSGSVLSANEVVITNGVKEGFAYNAGTKTATFRVKPNIGAVRVKVTVNANSVVDNLGNGNGETPKWFNVGPVLSIPANSHLVVVKDFNRQATFTFLSDDTYPTEGQINAVRPAILSARQIGISNWTEMPDLERMFDFSTGEGGGALVLKKAASQGSLARGAVGITEIMWASDLNRIGAVQDAEARYQWIELENLTNAAVNVHLFHRVGRETYTIENDEIDRAGNFYDGSLGNNRWNVGDKGQNGNSWTGVDFISMHRHLPNFGKNHNYANVNGMAAGAWVKSSLKFLTKVAGGPTKIEYWHRGTPGRRHVHGTDGTTVKAGVTVVPSSPVIFNEIANRSNEQYEWIELRNVSTGTVNLKNYAITFVTAVDTEHLFYAFPNNDNATIAAGGVLLLVDTDPRDNFEHPLAVGYDVDRNREDQIDGIAGARQDYADAPRYKITDFRSGGLPDDGKFILMLRKPEKGDGGGKPGKDYRNSASNIVDIAGYDNDGLRKTNYPATNPANLNNTDLWPLVNFPAPNFSNNKLEVERVHYRRNHTTASGRSGAGGVENKNEKSAFTDTGFSGIGYKRHVTRSNALGGDPGYHSITRGKVTELADRAVVTISEIMLSQGDRGYPQWIELYNNSRTQAVQLDADDGWKLVIENPDDPIGTINFKSKGAVKRILPNQTVLVVSGSARSAGSDFLAASTVFPATRTFNVYREVASQFDMRNRSASFVNPKAFHIKLIDGKGNLSDEIGNLDGKSRTNDKAKWEYPVGVTEDGKRTSLIRIYDDGVARKGTSMDESNVAPLGTKGNGTNQTPVSKIYSWVHAADTEASVARFIRHTWYGVETDHGTPGTRRGQILPVQLSHFRPTLEDGKVVIRWVTESEIDNAGFNIYRSETRDGEFTQVNEDMIQGNGTTAERSTYKWVDTSAKIGAVYYYQIEDVSFAGERQKLTTTKLKGLISAKGKLTTQWGELKEVQ